MDKKKQALLVLEFAKKNKKPEPESDMDDSDDESAPEPKADQGKVSAVRDLYRAMREDDEEAGVEALEAFLGMC